MFKHQNPSLIIMKNRYLLGWIFLLFLSACGVLSKQDIASEIDFIVLQLNDVYEIAPLEGGKTAGLARVATVRKQLLEENPNVITILSGDFLSPSFIGTLKNTDGTRIAGLQMIETLNALGLDYATFGNHEFDLRDPEVLQDRIDQSAFIWTTCNALRVKDGEKKPFTQKGKPVPSYLIHSIEGPAGNMLKVGILGVVLPFTQIDYVSYLPVTETFRSTFAELKQVTDLTLAMTHLAIEEDIELAAAVPGIPLFLGGHDHVNMTHKVGQTRITKADANAKTVYVHRITYNTKSEKVQIRSSLVPIDDRIAEEPKTQAVVDKWQKSTLAIMENMGYKPDQRLMETKKVLECKESAVRSRPTNYGTLTVEAFAAAIPNSDVYLINSGSMRLDDDIVGIVTQYDVLRTFPFGGAIVQMDLEGTEVQQLLDTGLITNQGEGGYFQISKVERKNEAWYIDNKILERNHTYSIVLPEFVAAGGETNLGFLKGLSYNKQEDFTINGKTVRNDIRDLVSSYMEAL